MGVHFPCPQAARSESRMFCSLEEEGNREEKEEEGKEGGGAKGRWGI